MTCHENKIFRLMSGSNFKEDFTKK